jgi:hypothetical protein
MSERPEEPFPLTWPAHKPRTPWQKRRTGQFSKGGKWIGRLDAIARVEGQVKRLGGAYLLVSSDLPLRKADGQPFKGASEPSDPGVCAYFYIKGIPYAMACDTYDVLAQNVAAIAAHLEATRAIERYGVATAAESLQAFQALPPPADVKPKRPWWEVFGVARDGVDVEDLNALFRSRARRLHPDQGGDAEAMSELNVALKEALGEVGK